AVSSMPSELGDFDLDGVLDILLVAPEGAGATPLLGQGDGTFVALPPLPGTSGAKSAALGHANGDGLLDAAMVVGTETQLAFGAGGGSFTTAATIPGLTGAVHFADTDRDGDDDLILGLQGLVTVQTLKDGQLGASGSFSVSNSVGQNADAAFLELGGVPSVAAVNTVVFVADLSVSQCGPDGLPTLDRFFPEVKGAPEALADVDGDGHKELVVVKVPEPIELVVHQVPGDGTIGPAGPVNPIAGTGFDSATVANLDGDAREDLILEVSDSGIRWLPCFSNGDGSFTQGTSNPAPFFGARAAYGDLDGDGDDDLLLMSQDPAWYATGTGGCGPPQAVVIPGLLAAVAPVVLVDADGDGLPELFMGSTAADGGVLREWKGLGNGSFAPPQVLTSGPHSTSILTAADLDGGGDVGPAPARPAPPS